MRLICGAGYAAVVGAVAPLLRFVIFGMPPLFPTGVAMCFELLAYGLAAGMLYGLLRRARGGMYLSLIGAMVIGRIVWGIVSAVLLTASGEGFTWAAFAAGAFFNALPGIVLHIVLIPVLVMALRRALPWMKNT